MKINVLILLLGISGVWSFQNRSYGEYGAEYLKLTRHGHAGGLGNAVGAWREDLAGVQFNPAIITAAKSHFAVLSHTLMTIDRQQQGLAYYSKPFGNLFFGVEAGRPGVERIDGRDRIVPVENYGVKMLSIGFFINPEDRKLTMINPAGMTTK